MQSVCEKLRKRLDEKAGLSENDLGEKYTKTKTVSFTKMVIINNNQKTNI